MKTFLVTLTVPASADGIQREGQVTVLHPNGVTFTRGPINSGYSQVMRDDGEKYCRWVLKGWFPAFGDWGRDGANASVTLMFDSRDHADDFDGNVSVWAVDLEPFTRKV